MSALSGKEKLQQTEQAGPEYVEAYAATAPVPSTDDGVVAFDALESNKDLLSGEAAVDLTPGGDFIHAVWNQWQETLDEAIFNSDAWYRRVFLDDDALTILSGSGGAGGGGGGGKPPKDKKK